MKRKYGCVTKAQLSSRKRDDFKKHATYASVSVSVRTPSTGKHTHSLERQLRRQEQMMRGSVKQQDTQTHTHVSPPTTRSVFKWTTVELLVGRNAKQRAVTQGCLVGVFSVRVRSSSGFYRRGQRVCVLQQDSQSNNKSEIVVMEICFEFKEQQAAG